jgi:hypothetical protein
MDKLGECWFLSTPKGKNWFYRMYLRQKKQPDLYRSFNFSSYDNPILNASEIKSLEEEFSDEISYRQEILAQFLDSGGIVFRNLKKCLGATLSGPDPTHTYVAGIDLGKHQDWTVITIGDTGTNEVVYQDRFNKLDWVYQKGRIKDALTLYNNACAVLDTTGIGDTVYDDLTDAGFAVEPFHFTNTTKNALISNLMRTMDNGLVQLPDDRELVEEFEAYEYNLSEQGVAHYGAPSGVHDDIVTSVALCVWGMNNAVVNVIGRMEEPPKKFDHETEYDEPDAIEYDGDDEDYQNLPHYGVNKVRLS